MFEYWLNIVAGDNNSDLIMVVHDVEGIQVYQFSYHYRQRITRGL